MKLYMQENAELMDVKRLKIEDGNLIVVGTIMGAMPTEAILTPAELRSGFKLLSFPILMAVIRMLFAK